MTRHLAPALLAVLAVSTAPPDARAFCPSPVPVTDAAANSRIGLILQQLGAAGTDIVALQGLADEVGTLSGARSLLALAGLPVPQGLRHFGNLADPGTTLHTVLRTAGLPVAPDALLADGLQVHDLAGLAASRPLDLTAALNSLDLPPAAIELARLASDHPRHGALRLLSTLPPDLPALAATASLDDGLQLGDLTTAARRELVARIPGLADLERTGLASRLDLAAVAADPLRLAASGLPDHHSAATLFLRATGGGRLPTETELLRLLGLDVPASPDSALPTPRALLQQLFGAPLDRDLQALARLTFPSTSSTTCRSLRLPDLSGLSATPHPSPVADAVRELRTTCRSALPGLSSFDPDDLFHRVALDQAVLAAVPVGIHGRQLRSCIQHGCNPIAPDHYAITGIGRTTWHLAALDQVLALLPQRPAALSDSWSATLDAEALSQHRHRPSPRPLLGTADPSVHPRQVPTDLLYLPPDGHPDTAQAAALHHARPLWRTHVALDAWAVARTERSAPPDTTAVLDALAERHAACTDLLCEARTLVDLKRLQADIERRTAELAIEHLRLATATTLADQRAHRIPAP